MSLEEIADKVIEADFLVIGGGIGGCCAAFVAADRGLNVVLLEKSGLDRSGSAGQGVDLLEGLWPREGLTTLDLTRMFNNESRISNRGQFQNINIKYNLIDQAWWVLDELEKHGITMRWDNGEYYWYPAASLVSAGHLEQVPEEIKKKWTEPGTPGYNPMGPRVDLRVHWQNVKPEMAAAVRKSGANVIERTMAIDLLISDGVVVGATALNTRTGEFLVIKSKVTAIATGPCYRLYDPETPLHYKYKMRYHYCPTAISGDGWAMAYRAGAELANMDIGSHAFRIREDLCIAAGLFAKNEGYSGKSFAWDGEELTRPSPAIYTELEQKGKTPIYRSLEHLPEDNKKKIERSIADERPISFKVSEDRGFDFRKHWFEISAKPCGLKTWPGINVDGDCKVTTLKGLYAIGEAIAGQKSCALAASSGMYVARTVGDYISRAREPAVDEGQVESQKQTVLAPLGREDGAEPLEIECSIRFICERYIGNPRSEGKLQEGKRRLDTLRRVWAPKWAAKDTHDLMRCLEARNILDCAELHLQGALERRETRRPMFLRYDCPDEDPALAGKALFQRLENGQSVFEWRAFPELKEEYVKADKREPRDSREGC